MARLVETLVSWTLSWPPKTRYDRTPVLAGCLAAQRGRGVAQLAYPGKRLHYAAMDGCLTRPRVDHLLVMIRSGLLRGSRCGQLPALKKVQCIRFIL